MGTIRDFETVEQVSSTRYAEEYIAVICDADRHMKAAAMAAQWGEERRKRDKETASTH